MKPYEIPDPSNPSKKLPLVMVEWVDARGYAAWQPFYEARDQPLVHCVCIGVLLSKDREKIVIGSAYNGVDDWAEVTSIPRTWQVKITKLGIVTEEN